jgi:hypothetical protein
MGCEETEVFRGRLKRLGMAVGGYMDREVVRGWGKFPFSVKGM